MTNIRFADKKFENAIVDALKNDKHKSKEYNLKLELHKPYIKPEHDNDLTLDELENIQSLICLKVKDGLRDLRGLEHLKNLNILGIVDNSVEDLTPLIPLRKLEELYIEGNMVHSLEPVRDLVGLQVVSFYSNAIRNVEPLSGLTNLKKLNLSLNVIDDITHLSNLKRLEFLDLSFNKIKYLFTMDKLYSLENLNLEYNNIEDFSNAFNYCGKKQFNKQRIDLDASINPVILELYDENTNLCEPHETWKLKHYYKHSYIVSSKQKDTVTTTISPYWEINITQGRKHKDLEEVDIPDKALKQQLLNILKDPWRYPRCDGRLVIEQINPEIKSSHATKIYKDDLENILALNHLENKDIVNITGFEHLINAIKIDISGTSVTNLSPVKRLSNLENLYTPEYNTNDI